MKRSILGFALLGCVMGGVKAEAAVVRVGIGLPGVYAAYPAPYRYPYYYRRTYRTYYARPYRYYAPARFGIGFRIR